jgi:hypothetical protein
MVAIILGVRLEDVAGVVTISGAVPPRSRSSACFCSPGFARR